MTTYYVNSGAGGSNTGGSWTNAYTAFGSAVTAATSAGDIIKVHVGHAEALGADTTYTFANNVQVICVDKDNSDALAAMNGTTQYIGHTSTAYAITLAGAYTVYFYGIALLVHAGIKNFILGGTGGAVRVFENCRLSCGSLSIQVGGQDKETSTILIGSTVAIMQATHIFLLNGALELYDVTIDDSSASPYSLVKGNATDPGGATALVSGCDLSPLGTAPILADCTTAAVRVTVDNCKLAASFVALEAQTNANRSGGEIYLYNCYSGDAHIHMQHHNSLGATICDTGIYATSNICDSNLSWKIVGTANATFYMPYQSPWIDVYHTGTSAITPSLECVRSGSSTAYNNDTLWSEWSYQGTSGYPQAVFVYSDRMTPLGSAAAQTTGALGASDWTGENATSWFGKLAPAASFTPAEAGHVRVRVCVAGANTVYVDPQIRGLS